MGWSAFFSMTVHSPHTPDNQCKEHLCVAFRPLVTQYITWQQGCKQSHLPHDWEIKEKRGLGCAIPYEDRFPVAQRPSPGPTGFYSTIK